MSYTGWPFRHDIFLSYSHRDALGDGTSPLQRWSQAFASELQNELRTLLRKAGRELSVFVDQSHRTGQGIDPLEPLSPQLQSEIAASAIVAVLLSPHYLDSQWCADERDWWYRGQEALKFSPSGRIALARIWPLADTDKLPELFLDGRGEAPTGFWFYDRSESPTQARPYEWPAATNASAGSFRKALVELAGSVFEKLNAIRARLEEARKHSADATKLETDPVIYLHGRSSDKASWDKANDMLSQGGFTVFPAEPDSVARSPEEAQKLRNDRLETLVNCDALLLLGSPDIRAADADLLAIGRHERQLARARYNRLLPCALLDAIGETDVSKRRQLAARKLQVDWIDSHVDPWVPEVQSWLRRKGQDLAEGL